MIKEDIDKHNDETKRGKIKIAHFILKCIQNRHYCNQSQPKHGISYLLVSFTNKLHDWHCDILPFKEGSENDCGHCHVVSYLSLKKCVCTSLSCTICYRERIEGMPSMYTLVTTYQLLPSY